MPVREVQYWPRLVRLVVVLCRFYKSYKSKLPDVGPQTSAMLALVEAACEELVAYDAAHAGGRGV